MCVPEGLCHYKYSSPSHYNLMLMTLSKHFNLPFKFGLKLFYQGNLIDTC